MVRGAAFILVVLLAVFQIGTCLQCYKCISSADGASCGETFSATDKKVDCSNVLNMASINTDNRKNLHSVFPDIALLSTGDKHYCLKVTDPDTTARTCAYADSEEKIKTICVPGTATTSCQYCDTDLCNGSSAIASSIPVAMLALVATYFLYKL